MNNCEINLRITLEHLAMSYNAQRAYLESIGNENCVDELALEFYDAFLLYKTSDKVDPYLLTNVSIIDSRLNEMSTEKHKDLWSLEGLFSSPIWENIRKLARACLSLGESRGLFEIILP